MSPATPRICTKHLLCARGCAGPSADCASGRRLSNTLRGGNERGGGAGGRTTSYVHPNEEDGASEHATPRARSSAGTAARLAFRYRLVPPERAAPRDLRCNRLGPPRLR